MADEREVEAQVCAHAESWQTSGADGLTLAAECNQRGPGLSVTSANGGASWALLELFAFPALVERPNVSIGRWSSAESQQFSAMQLCFLWVLAV